MVVALGLAAAPGAADFAIRMRESSAAAQALQGPLDGTWTLSETRQTPLYIFQITDAVSGVDPLAGAWRRPEPSGATGLIDVITRKGDRLTIHFADGADTPWIHLRRRNARIWSGEASVNGHETWVSLRRTAPPATPP